MLVSAFPITLPAGELARLEQVLSPSERARAARIIRPDARRRFVVTRARLRELLGEVLDIAARDLRLDDRPGAAPILERGRVPISFSASHSGEMALIAISDTVRVGADIERIRPRKLLREIAARTVDAGALDPSDPVRDFYTQWTAMEARFKAGDPGADVEHLETAPGYAAAVAYARDVYPRAVLAHRHRGAPA